jgi:tetratricopeptide (TPR) repeat protein
MTGALVALLLAAPERVVLLAKQPEPPGFFARLEKSLDRAMRRLYEREDDDVARGNALAAQDDPESALREYDKARARLPDDAGVAFNRATVLLKHDPSKAGEAASEAGRALQRGDAALKPKAAYHLALATEAMGHADEAIRQYGAALSLDPLDVDSKVNLELLLRTQDKQRPNPAGQPRENQRSRQEGQQKPQRHTDDAARKQQERSSPQKSSPGQQAPPQQQDQPQDQAAQQQAQAPEQKAQPASPKGGTEKPVDRSEAQRLLDALRASEKNLQTWRFARKKTDVRKRSDPEKDW